MSVPGIAQHTRAGDGQMDLQVVLKICSNRRILKDIEFQPGSTTVSTRHLKGSE